MKTVLISTFIALSTIALGQAVDKFEPFKSSDYPTGKFHIKLDTATFLNFKIKIRQVHKEIKNPVDIPCHAWLTITKGKKIIKQLYYPSLESAGNCYGIFMPDEQPRNDYFFISTFGAYEGYIFIIDTSGKVIEKEGGFFYISNNKQYLFSPFASDLSGLTIYDLNKKQILFSDTIEPYLGDWYFQDGKYFAEIWEPSSDRVNNNQIAIYNFKTNKLITTDVDKDYVKPENKLLLYNDPNHSKACNCGQ